LSIFVHLRVMLIFLNHRLMKKLFTVFITLSLHSAVFAQESPFPAATTTALPASDIRLVNASPGSSPAETAVRVGKSFLGRPYVAHTLEETESEQLVVNFRTFDCTTFVETTMALALALHELPEHNLAKYDQLFRTYLTKIRYRNGVVDGYASRLHYFSEWLRDNERKGLLRDVTRHMGGIQVAKPVSYMTAYPWKYPKLTDPSTYRQVASIEAAISQQSFYFIPKKNIRAIENQLKEGDIVMLMAARPGLDMKHVGFVVWQDGHAHLLHASSEYGEVVITEESLADYVLWHRHLSGIRVARLKGPTQPLAARK